MSERLIPVPRYKGHHRDVLRAMIIEAHASGVPLPPDMPCDTEEHIQAAIVFVARLYGRHVARTYAPSAGSMHA